MHIKTKSLLVFCLTMFVSFSSFGGITERFAKWKDEFFADQAKKLVQAVDDIYERNSKELKIKQDSLISNDSESDKLYLCRFSNFKTDYSVRQLLLKMLGSAVIKTFFYSNNVMFCINNLLDKNYQWSSQDVKPVIKCVGVGFAAGLAVMLAKYRFKTAIFASVLTTILGLGFLSEGQIRTFANNMTYNKFYVSRIPIEKSFLVYEKLSILEEFIGSELNLPINTDGRSFISIHPKLLKVLLKNAEAHQSSIFSRIIANLTFNQYGAKSYSLPYNQIRAILDKNTNSNDVQVPKNLLIYLLKNVYKESIVSPLLAIPLVGGNSLKSIPYFWDLLTMDRVIRTYDVDSRSCEIVRCINFMKSLLDYEFKRDADGTPRIYKKDPEGNLIQDDEAMKLCGLHGIPYSMIPKDKQEHQTSSNSYSSILKEQREQEAVA